MSNIEKETYINLGKNIRKYRLKANISQEKLSESLNTNMKYIGHVERFERYVSLKKLIQIANLLKVDLKDLFDFDKLC